MFNIFKKRTIFDLGVNDGSDTAFYLEKGFRVVAVEANPILAEAVRLRFCNEIQAGTLVLLNVGIWHDNRTLPFYINQANDHWSSFDPEYGCRNGTPFTVVDVPCMTIVQLLESYGLPYYMKIDIEGADKVVLGQMQKTQWRPKYISVEEYGVVAIDDLRSLGYKKFAIVSQRDKTVKIAPKIPLEGRGFFLNRQFNGTVSGVFGREIQDKWLAYDDARMHFIRSVRREDYTWVGPDYEWFDIHAKF